MDIEIEILQAYEGDSILLSLIDNDRKYRILVDGGVHETYEDILKEKLESIFDHENEQIDLLIVTHIDDDHIGGIKALFEDSNQNQTILKNKIKRIWFNSAQVIANSLGVEFDEKYSDRIVRIVKDNETKISKSNANTLEKEIQSLGIELSIIKAPQVFTDIPNIKLTILSPTDSKLKKLHKEWIVPSVKISSTSNDYDTKVGGILTEDTNRCIDSSNANGASIAFILEFKGKTILMLGDAHDTVVRKSLRNLGYSKSNKLKANVVKISHHGSNNNTSKKLIEMIECGKYIISSDGSRSSLPGKKCLSRIIKYSSVDPVIYFNYDVFDDIFKIDLNGEDELYNSKCKYLTDKLEV